MNIRFNYLNESYYQKLEKIIKKIRNYTCPNCGGKYENETCVFCYATNNDLKNDIEILNQILINITNDIEILNINNIPINTLFNLLNSLPFKITSIKNFLNKYHYQENFDEFTNEILTKINSNDTLTALEINCLETLIYQNNNDKTNNLYNYFINNCARGKINASFECYKLLIKQFVEKLLKAFYKNPKCIITDEQKEHNGLIVSGKSKNHKVWINSLEIEEMYKTGNYNLINTIFHELTHGIQYKNIFNGNQTIDPLVILEIKDSILSENLPNYYKENYNNISFEIEAQYYGLLLSTRYLGINIHLIPELEEKLNNLQQKILNKKRVFQGETIDIDLIFNRYIYKHPELLEKHPQLYILYKKVDDKVLPLTKEEIYLKYNEIINNQNINDNEKEKYQLLFSNYISIPKENPIQL